MLVLALALLALQSQKPPEPPSVRASASTESAEARLDEARELLERAVSAEAARDLTDARARIAEALELLDREPRVELDGPSVELVNELGLIAWQALAPDLARAAWTRAVEAFERTVPEDDPDLASLRNNLAAALRELGDLAGARELQEAVLASRERTLPDDHEDLVRARTQLATTLRALGELDAARALQEKVLATCERLLPDDHDEVLTARNRLAGILREMGDLEGARAHQEAVLAVRERTLPDDHDALASVRGNLAVTLSEMGDFAGARALEEAVLAARERTLPDEHPDLLTARGNLAVTLRMMGDPAGARVLHEAVLAVCERTLPEDHPRLVRARGNLATTLSELGDLEGARKLEEAALASCERTLPEDHPRLVTARANLAVTLGQLGDREGARTLQESVLASCERTLPEDHAGLVLARSNLAATLVELGEPAEARALQESVLASCERTLPADHPELATARGNLAVVLASLEDRDALREQTVALAHGVESRLAGSLAGSPRAAGERALAESHRLGFLLFFAEILGSPPELERVALETIELARHVRAAGGLHLADEDASEDLARLRAEVRTLRRRLNDQLAAEGGGEDLARLVLERDAVEARLRRRLAASGAFLERIDAGALAAALPADAAAVGYWRYTRYRLEGEERRRLRGEDALLAHVLRKDGTLRRVELGPIDELDTMVETWRDGLGKPLSGRGGTERGVSVEADETGDADATREHRAAERLRARYLDPVLAAAGEDVTTLFVCFDDALHLLPLDALPWPSEDGDEPGSGLVGDRLDLRFEVSFARLIRARARSDGEPVLAALGGASFDLSPGASEAEDDATVEPLAVRAGTDRAGPAGQTFGPLRGTRVEVENIAQLYDEVFEREALVLTRKDATKSALAGAARGARWLHVATHGYFAPESVKSTADPEPDPDALWSPMTAEERVTGLAPMTLCGLALAGANLGRDSLGRVPGILTAEELAGWDLSQCELAVLSACETNVGITRAGQGLQSLQAALHMAGARSSITSLWKVDDELTRRLMEDLYTRLWVHGEPKAEALWNAKMALRSQGARTRDWAGWALVGAPD